MKPKVLIAGIGNIFQGDDAFGVEVTRLLMQRSLPHDVRVKDFGIRGFDLAYALMDGPEFSILIDAVPNGERPGTLFVIEPDLEDLEGTEIDTHTMTPRNVFALVKSLGGAATRVMILGCQPGDLGGEDGRMGLTDDVAAAVSTAADLAVSMATDFLEGRDARAVDCTQHR